MASLFWLVWLVPHVPATVLMISLPCSIRSWTFPKRLAALAERPAALVDRPADVLILTALDIASSDASGQEPNGDFD
ncbi:hypothetical protein F2Q69_00023016 [Brassica cretica]|uniref:Uncharacterized protein n=1 Tax=Brassica cretica TaxID=69181 RepID=A0A8S9QEC3_BRACR|nr:hypothetical protein F2Q69_00023016 [Brassica cretica]